ncbi:MAG TPA: alcohol dehydrogenase catalytic domain-containing protein [Firmicutes bacterium]|jgi:2-desacetyl-2-hydroxyethyl bacteriochlorophyllide A dehydrogenase|nr:alcohol dehydrogenase catalytic domain-containing protein [Bacillota bacterium]
MSKKQTFKRAEIVAPGEVAFSDVEKREPDNHEVLIRVKSSAICGSDMHIYSGKHPYVQLPTTIGHELAGVVEAVGAEVTTVKEGDRVCVEPLITCGKCYYCQRGRYDYCLELKLKYRSGFSGYAEYYYAEERWIHHLPENVSFDEGALMEPLACAVHAVRKPGIQVGDSVCILGDGPIALMLTQLAFAAGATDLYVLGLDERNLALAREFGAVAMPNTEEAFQEILRRTDHRGVDVSFEAVGLPKTFNQALSIVAKGGTAVIFGIFEEEFSAKTLVDAMVREVKVIGTSSYCWDFQRALSLVSHGRIKLDPLVTHRFKLADVGKAMALKKQGSEAPLKIILEP